jgi:hypothetical protein
MQVQLFHRGGSSTRLLRAALNKTSLIVLAVLLLTAVGRGVTANPRSDDPPAIETIVRRILDAYGGTAVLGGVHAFSATGVLESPLYEGPAKYSVALEQEGRKLRVEIAAGNAFELRILNGTRGYYQATDSPMAGVSGSRFLAKAYQYKELTMLHQLMTSSFTIVDGGRSTVNGTPARLLLLSDKEGPPMKLYVDTKTYRIIRDSGVFAMDGAQTELSSEFRDFRKVHGRLFPFRIINYAGGQKIGELHIREYAVNPVLPDSLFMPGDAAGK